MDKYKRVDIAIDAYYNDPNAVQPVRSSGVSTTKLNQVFDQYKGMSRFPLDHRHCISVAQIQTERISVWMARSSSVRTLA